MTYIPSLALPFNLSRNTFIPLVQDAQICREHLGIFEFQPRERGHQKPGTFLLVLGWKHGRISKVRVLTSPKVSQELTIFQLEKSGQKCSNSHANPLGHSFTLSSFSLALSKKNPDLKHRERGLRPSPSSSFTTATQGLAQQSNCQKVALFHSSPNKLSCLLSLKMHPEQVHQECHKTNSPTAAAIHIFNLFVCRRIKFIHCSPITPLLIHGLVSALHPLELKNKIKQRGTQASEIQCVSEQKKRVKLQGCN